MKTAVITFPGSNCDRDIYTALRGITGKEPYKVWHGDSSLPEGVDFIAIPGGFSYGDYLRSGAIAAKSPIMNEVVKAAERGVYIAGICNGFQVLTETGLLPGTLMRNRDLKFICKTVNLKVAANDSIFTGKYKAGQVIKIPVAHHDGNYFADKKTVMELEENNRIAFRYCDENGNIADGANPNGSVAAIAGVFSNNKRVIGMMPHPERAVDILTGGVDGRPFFEAIM